MRLWKMQTAKRRRTFLTRRRTSKSVQCSFFWFNFLTQRLERLDGRAQVVAPSSPGAGSHKCSAVAASVGGPVAPGRSGTEEISAA
ncbi:hypothetical protein BC832DRAFT_387716 [Gaertneriomyces semiglobifer]|nr:hypothetical protein BC832DRAFT_387716 [Gaertneriomyces semiglobifer]